MGYFLKCKQCIIVKRHFFLLLFSVIKFIVLFIISSIICYVAHETITQPGLFKTTLYILGIATLNYGFLRLVLGLIRYYNNLIIICPEQIVIIRASLLLKDKIESLDSFKIMKLDSMSNGFISNIFGYGNMTIEQHNDELRVFHFIPQPYKVVKHIKDQQKRDKKKTSSIQIKQPYDTIDYPIV